MPKSDIAVALEGLQKTAETFIYTHTQRQMQLGREKEGRLVDAYKYMLTEENEQILELETALDTIENNLLTKGVELESLSDEKRTIPSKELLTAANESAMNMVMVELNASKDYKRRLEEKKRKALAIHRKIDEFDEVILSELDPTVSGWSHIVDAKDVATAAGDYIEQQTKVWEWSDVGDPLITEDPSLPELQQRLEALKSPSGRKELQVDYYARLKEEKEQQILHASAGQTEAKIKIETLEPIKKESQEAVHALAYRPLSRLVEQYGTIITRQGELDDLEADDKEVATIKEDILAEERRVGATFFPWAYSQDHSESLARGLQSALVRAAGNPGARLAPNYTDLIEYFKIGHIQYKKMLAEGNPVAQVYQTDMMTSLGIDIADEDWIRQLLELNEISNQVDIEQAMEMLKIGKGAMNVPTFDLSVPSGQDKLDKFLKGKID